MPTNLMDLSNRNADQATGMGFRTYQQGGGDFLALQAGLALGRKVERRIVTRVERRLMRLDFPSGHIFMGD